jgi:hypothetical protein
VSSVTKRGGVPTSAPKGPEWLWGHHAVGEVVKPLSAVRPFERCMLPRGHCTCIKVYT